MKKPTAEVLAFSTWQKLQDESAAKLSLIEMQFIEFLLHYPAYNNQILTRAKTIMDNNMPVILED